MSQETQPHDITKKKVVYQLPGVDAITIQRDLECRVSDADVLSLDIYYPPEANSGAPTPAVIFVLGYSDSGFQKMLGCKQKEMQSYISWAQLVAASGLVAITYTTTEPTTDIHALLEYLQHNAASLGIDDNRIGLWACSGNVPNALSVLMKEGSDNLKCAVVCYGMMLDLEGDTSVAESAKKWGFVNPCGGKTVNDVAQNIPLFIVRAGKDETPHLNETIDRFMAGALIYNLPIRFANHAAGRHSFDVMDDSEASREIIRQILAFMQYHLLS